MTTTNDDRSEESGEILKTDVLGRIRIRPEEREKILDAFEASGMSGAAFAKLHGVKQQTFASWIQKRRRARGDYDNVEKRRELRMGGPRPKNKTSQQKQPFALIEVETSSQTSPNLLEVELPGGALVKLTSPEQINLLKNLLRELSC